MPLVPKPVRKGFKKIFNKERLWKVIIVLSTMALLATSILPYILGG